MQKIKYIQSNQRGITLIEILVGLVILSLAVTLGTLGLNQLSTSFQKTNSKLDIQNQTREINEILTRMIKNEEQADVTLDSAVTNNCSFKADEFSNNNTLININSYSIKYDFDGKKVSKIKKVYYNGAEETLYEPTENLTNEYIKSIQTCLNYQNKGGLAGDDTIFSESNTIATFIHLKMEMSSGLTKTFSTKIARLNWTDALQNQVAFNGGASAAPTSQPYSKSITIDGTNDFTTSNPDQKIISSTGTYDSFLSWDANYVYLGFAGLDVANDRADKWVIAYINGTDGTATGVKYKNNKAPTLAFKAKYQIQLNMTASIFIIKAYNPTTNAIDTIWASKNCSRNTICRTDGKDVTFTANSTNKFIEIKLPRADMALPSVIKLNSYFLNEYDNYWSWAHSPTGAAGDGADQNITFTKYLKADMSASSYSKTTPDKDDIISPTTPTSLTTSAQTTNSITLSWGASTDSSNSVKYALYRNNVLIKDEITSTTHTDTDLASGNTYNYSVKSYDPTGNYSQASNSINVTTTSNLSVTVYYKNNAWVDKYIKYNAGSGFINPPFPKMTASSVTDYVTFTTNIVSGTKLVTAFVNKNDNTGTFDNNGGVGKDYHLTSGTWTIVSNGTSPGPVVAGSPSPTPMPTPSPTPTPKVTITFIVDQCNTTTGNSCWIVGGFSNWSTTGGIKLNTNVNGINYPKWIGSKEFDLSSTAISYKAVVAPDGGGDFPSSAYEKGSNRTFTPNSTQQINITWQTQ